MKHCYKILQLPSWADPENVTEEEFRACVGEPQPPFFSRHGLYVNRRTNTAWVESPFGCFDVTREIPFLRHTLKMLSHSPLHPRERLALEALRRCHSRAFTPTLADLLATDEHWHEVRNLRRGVPC